MKSDEKLYEICIDIYREMYEKAFPSADLDKLIIAGITKKKDWFMNYYLPLEEQQKIVDFHCKKNHCSKYEKKKIESEVWLGCSPSINLKRLAKKIADNSKEWSL